MPSVSRRKKSADPIKSYPRSYRIASLVRRGLSPILAVAHAGVTVRRVSLNRDMSIATVHYSLMGGGDAVAAREALTQNSVRLRRRLAAVLNMRATPQLVFTPDDEGIAADDMQKLLDSIMASAAASPE